jgi:hypothetical protein
MRPQEARNREWEDRPRLSRERQERFFAAAEEATRFFMGEADVQRAVAFPDPASSAVRGERVALLPLPRLLELKLASGMTAPHRLKDLADVLEVIRILELSADLEEQLDPYVREEYRELWQAAQIADQE